jgi:hypothetical protein
MHSSRTPELDAINRIFKYLKGTPEKGLWMKNNNSNDICSYLMQIEPKILIKNQQPTFAYL